MLSFPPTVILRHRKENLKKCSLRGLEERPDIHFFTYPKDILHGGDSLRFGRRESSANPSFEEGAVWNNTAPSSGEGLAGFDVAKTQRITTVQYTLPDLSSYFLLTLDAPPLTKADCELGIFLIDGTWRYAELMQRQLPHPHLFQRRSLPPGFCTAYPRRQEDCPEPSNGLASVEALFLAYSLLGRSTDGILDHFYWKEKFLSNLERLTF